MILRNQVRCLNLALLLMVMGCAHSSPKLCAESGGTWVHSGNLVQVECWGKDKFGHRVRVHDASGKSCPLKALHSCYTPEKMHDLTCRGAACWNKKHDYTKTYEEILREVEK